MNWIPAFAGMTETGRSQRPMMRLPVSPLQNSDPQILISKFDWLWPNFYWGFFTELRNVALFFLNPFA
ncbi:MAG: hypothetical protein OER98_17600, partial [Gammaproteobacteria bacterium]|nr:hypothetical protein [Gammaproteobacteria bacterium]